MKLVIDTDDYPSDERVDRWCALVSDAVATMTNVASDAGSFHGRLWAAEFGSISVSAVETSPIESRRTATHIRRHDPEMVILSLCEQGTGQVTQDRSDAPMRARDMACLSTWRPFRTMAHAHVPHPVRATVVAVPRALLPVKADKLDQAMATTLSPGKGPSSLLREFLRGLVTSDVRHDDAAAARLGNVLVDLLCVSLTHLLGSIDDVPSDMGERLLLRRAKAFVMRHLADPELSLAQVAAALHLSPRSLHRLFQQENLGVAAWIREQRLEQYRRALLDPTLSSLPVLAVAAQCGLGTRTQFQLFRAAYGMTPGEYRRTHVRKTAGAHGSDFHIRGADSRT